MTRARSRTGGSWYQQVYRSRLFNPFFCPFLLAAQLISPDPSSSEVLPSPEQDYYPPTSCDLWWCRKSVSAACKRVPPTKPPSFLVTTTWVTHGLSMYTHGAAYIVPGPPVSNLTPPTNVKASCRRTVFCRRPLRKMSSLRLRMVLMCR